jgi:hypothetical protein
MRRAARTAVPCRSSGCWNAGPAANSHRSRQVAADRQEVLTLRYLDGTQRKYVVIKHVKHAKSATWSQWDDRLKHVLEIGLVVYQCQVEPARRRSCVVRYDHSTPGLDSSRKRTQDWRAMASTNTSAGCIARGGQRRRQEQAPHPCHETSVKPSSRRALDLQEAKRGYYPHQTWGGGLEMQPRAGHWYRSWRRGGEVVSLTPYLERCVQM